MAMQIVSLVWGILSIIGMLIALTPCLGALNWLVIPFATIGVVLGAVALAMFGKPSKGMSIAGLSCSIVAVVLSLIRLVLGGGVV